MQLIFSILGILGIIAAVISVIFSIQTTPDNLRGFYGKKYIGIASIGIIILIVFIVLAFVG